MIFEKPIKKVKDELFYGFTGILLIALTFCAGIMIPIHFLATSDQIQEIHDDRRLQEIEIQNDIDKGLITCD